MQCNTGEAPFQYSWQGSNAYYLKMQISNTRWEIFVHLACSQHPYLMLTHWPEVKPVMTCRVPVAAVKFNGSPMQRSEDGYWLMNGGPFKLPAQLTITSILDDTVTGMFPQHADSCMALRDFNLPSFLL